MEDNYNNDQFGFELKRALLEDTPLPDADKAFMQFKKNIGVTLSGCGNGSLHRRFVLSCIAFGRGR